MAANSDKPRQTRLFETEHAAATRGRGAVGPADVPPGLRRTAERLPANVRLGTSSWSFPGWAGLVYDRTASKGVLARRGLEAYARHPLLRAVGIDRTYYAPIEAGDFAEYAAAVPDDFRFLVKAPADCTTPALRDDRGRYGERNPRFLDVEYAVERIVTPVNEGLGSKASTILFQFPPLGRRHTGDPARFAEELHGFLDRLPEGPTYAVEIRDRGVFGERYLAAVDSAGARHCFNCHPRMPSIAEQLQAAAPYRNGPIVARWMLGAGLRYESAVERYEPFSKLVDEDRATRETLSALCVDPGLRQYPIVIVANNKAEGSAPLTVFELARSIAARLGETGPGGS
jgi:uncharacterized protein YecE (DUF72 family)